MAKAEETNELTESITDGPTDSATDGATNSSTDVATDVATGVATDGPTDVATDGSTDGATESAGDEAAIEVVDVPELDRYELLVDGKRAGLAQYRLAGERVIVTHAEVSDEFAGRGLGSLLARSVIGDIRRRGRTITPLCPFVVSYLERHAEEQDVVDKKAPGGLKL